MSVRPLGVSLLGAALALTAGCGREIPPPDAQPSPVHSPTTTAHPLFDPGLEPAEAVLAMVPGSATTLTVTDFDEIRKDLGVPDLTSDDPVSDRFDFWERARTEAPLLAEGMLRADNSEFLLDYGFTQDDVDWEAHFTGPEGNGFVLGLPARPRPRPRVPCRRGRGRVARRGRVIAEDHLVVAGTAEDGVGVWAHDPTWTGLVGEPAEATYLRRGCIPLNDALGPDAGAEEQQDLLAKRPVTNLDDLAGFTVALRRPQRDGPDGAEPRRPLRPDRPRPGLAGAGIPGRVPFGGRRPGSGRIGYAVPRPAQAAALTLLEELPFAVCNERHPDRRAHGSLTFTSVELRLEVVQLLHRLRGSRLRRVGVGAEQPVGGAGRGDGEPVVLVLVVVQPVVAPDRPEPRAPRPVVAVHRGSGSTRSRA